MTERLRAGGNLVTLTREEWLRRLRFRRGDHITIVGPTGCGKTYAAWQILGKVTSPAFQGVALVKKPRDAQIVKDANRLRYRMVRSWPPVWSLWKPRKPPGYVVWPRTNFGDVEADRYAKYVLFRRVLADVYRKGNRIAYVDDAFGFSALLNLKEELTELWTELRSMDASLMTAFQRPSMVPLWAYSSAEHLLLFNDPDKRSRDRFAEIGGVDPDLVKDTVHALPEHHFVYIKRTGPRMCIVAP